MKKLLNLQSFLWVIFALGLSLTLTLSACNGSDDKKKEEEKTEQTEQPANDAEHPSDDAEHPDGDAEHPAAESDTMMQDTPMQEEHSSGGNNEHPNGN